MVVVQLCSIIEDQLQSNDFNIKAVAFEKIQKLLKDIVANKYNVIFVSAEQALLAEFTAGCLNMILTTAFQLSCATFLITLRAFESSISFTLGLEEKFKCTTMSRDFGFSKKLGSMPKLGDSSSSLLMFWSLNNNAELLAISCHV